MEEKAQKEITDCPALEFRKQSGGVFIPIADKAFGQNRVYLMEWSSQCSWSNALRAQSSWYDVDVDVARLMQSWTRDCAAPYISPSYDFPSLMASTDVSVEPDVYRPRTLSASPSVVSIAPGTIRPSMSQRNPGPSISARTSFTRVGPDDEEGPLFPARPATASAAMAAPQLQHLRPRLFDLHSAGSVSSFRSDADGGESQPGPDSDPPPPQETTVEQVASPSGISPSSLPHQSQPSAVPQTPQTFITFLLVTGRRRTMSFEPENTIGRVKELVWNTWPEGACALLACKAAYNDPGDR